MMSMLLLAVFFSMVSRAIFSPLMPFIQKEMGITLSTVGSLFLLVSTSYGVAMLCSGFMAAHIGHGRTIVVALTSMTIGLACAAIAANVLTIAAGFIFIGAGCGIYPPSGLVMINANIAGKKRSKAHSLHEIGPNVALLLAPVMVLIIEPWLGWRGVLAGLAFICGLASLIFFRWGLVNSGFGTAPNFKKLWTIVRLRSTILGMVILSATVAGIQGVYAILPAYLVTEYSFSPQYVNSLLIMSRIASILFLLRGGQIINYLGKRKTIIIALLFSALCTALLGVIKGSTIFLIVVAQPALLAVLLPALLVTIGETVEIQNQNVTYAVIITFGISFGGGVFPAMLGLFADLGHGGLGFVILAGYMTTAILFLVGTPNFGNEKREF